MPITSPILRNLNMNPSWVSFTCDDSFSIVTSNGYLLLPAVIDSIQLYNNGNFEFLDNDFIMIEYEGGQGTFFFDSAINAFTSQNDESPLPNGNILIGDASNVGQPHPLSVDVTMTNTGAVTIANNAITTPKIINSAVTTIKLADASVATSKLQDAAVSTPKIASSAVTNDKIASNAVDTPQINAASVTLSKLSATVAPLAIVKAYGQLTTVGGSTTENFTIPAIAAGDLNYLQMVNNGPNTVGFIRSTNSPGVLSVTFNGDPGLGAVFNYQILRLAT